MKKHILLVVGAVILIGIQFVVNCSSPLESTSELDSPPTIQVIVVDTVIVVVSDTSGSLMICSRLNSYQQEIVWMFRNQAGKYRLEFSALIEREHPTQTLSVDIDGQQFQWLPAESAEFILEQNLEVNALMQIVSTKPSSFGHAIDICLTVSTL